MHSWIRAKVRQKFLRVPACLNDTWPSKAVCEGQSHPASSLMFLEGHSTVCQPSESNSLTRSKWTTASPVRENISVANLIISVFLMSRRWYVDYVTAYPRVHPLVNVFFSLEVSAFSYSRMKINSRLKINDGKSSTLLITRTFSTRLIQLAGYEHLLHDYFFFVN